MDSLYMTYNGTGFLVGNGSDGKKINNIGPAALNDNTQLTNLKTMYLRMEDSSVTFRA